MTESDRYISMPNPIEEDRRAAIVIAAYNLDEGPDAIIDMLDALGLYERRAAILRAKARPAE